MVARYGRFGGATTRMVDGLQAGGRVEKQRGERERKRRKRSDDEELGSVGEDEGKEGVRKKKRKSGGVQPLGGDRQ